MNCEEARRHWSLYHDSEGDSELYVQINDHLAHCPACAEWFHQESHLEGLIAQRLQDGAPTAQLWQAVLQGAGIQRPRPVRRWVLFGGMGGTLLAVAAGLLVAAWLGVFSAEDAAPDLAYLAAGQHEQLAAGNLKFDYSSTSDLAVENYLRSRVNFPVRCPPRRDTGFAVQGAGVSQLAGQATAYVFGSVDGRPVSVFILSRDSLSKFPAQQRAVRNGVIHRDCPGAVDMLLAEIDQNVVLVIGPVGPQRLSRVLKAYGTYHHGEHKDSRV